MVSESNKSRAHMVLPIKKCPGRMLGLMGKLELSFWCCASSTAAPFSFAGMRLSTGACIQSSCRWSTGQAHLGIATGATGVAQRGQVTALDRHCLEVAPCTLGHDVFE